MQGFLKNFPLSAILIPFTANQQISYIPNQQVNYHQFGNGIKQRIQRYHQYYVREGMILKKIWYTYNDNGGGVYGAERKIFLNISECI